MYPTIQAALAEVKTNPATAGLVTAEYDGYLTNLLTLSAGVMPTGETEYRPFYVAARLLEQLRSGQTLLSADGVVFTGLIKPIASLFAQQGAIDQALSLIVPPGFDVPLPTHRRYFTRSFSTQTRP